MKRTPGRLARCMGWGLAGLLLGAEARAREPAAELAGLGTFIGAEPVAPGPQLLTPWRSTFHLDGPHRWMRQSVWAGTWGGAWEENVADFVVPYPVPEAVMYVTATDAELLVEPSPAALRAGPFLPYAPVSVLRARPWLPPGFVAVFVNGRVTGFLPRGVLSEAPPPVERLLAEARAALERRELERVQKLAWAARELYSGDARTLALVRALKLSENEWMPPELASPGAELPAPGAHVLPGASLYVGAPLLPLLKRRSAGAAPESWLAINTAVLVLDVAGGWARVRETFPAEQAALVGRDGAVQWRAWPREFEEGEAREGYVVARYLETAPVDPRALRALARSPRTKGSPEEALALLERAFAAEPWNEEARLDAFEWALKRKLAARPPPSAWLPVRADALEVLGEGPFLAQEAFGAPTDAPEAPGLEAVLYYGCGGDVLRAEVFSEQDAAVQEELANGTSALPVDICLKDVDAAPPQPPPHHVACPELSDEEEDTPEHRAALDREEAEARRQYETELRPAFERRLKQLREHFPKGPYLCVSVTNPAPRPRVNLRVQYYALPAVEEACEPSSKRPRPAPEPLRVGEVVVPYLASDAKVDLCIEVPRYEGMLYGVLLAPEVKAAELFVRRLAWIQQEAEASEQATSWEYREALSSLLPHATVSTEFLRECEETCY